MLKTQKMAYSYYNKKAEHLSKLRFLFYDSFVIAQVIAQDEFISRV